MSIVKWTTSDIPDLEHYGIVEILTEIDSKGVVLREIGVSPSGEVSYIAPTRRGLRPYGFFDGLVIDVSSLGSTGSGFSQEKFEALWAEGHGGNPR